MEGDVTDQVLGCHMHVPYISGEPIPKPWIVNKDSCCEGDQIVLTELQTLRCFYGHPDSLRTVKWWSADRLMEKWNLWLLYGIFLVWIDSSQNIGDTFYPREWKGFAILHVQVYLNLNFLKWLDKFDEMYVKGLQGNF